MEPLQIFLLYEVSIDLFNLHLKLLNFLLVWLIWIYHLVKYVLLSLTFLKKFFDVIFKIDVRLWKVRYRLLEAWYFVDWGKFCIKARLQSFDLLLDKSDAFTQWVKRRIEWFHFWRWGLSRWRLNRGDFAFSSSLPIFKEADPVIEVLELSFRGLVKSLHFFF